VSAGPLYDQLFDTLRARGHRPGLHLVPDASGGVRRAWLDAAGFGALGDSIEQAAAAYARTGGSQLADPELRDDLRRLTAAAER
jgi:hypothetical protein